ncbi:hypothetical protein [Proteus mirabilis]|uniref:hypothetical protein n=1 Tax=Proteus mirabilis TaxID=584 RepID=UPI0025777185|nr:hypothetical protein [Proteus mirabilis]MDM3843343.1 hypothetical protein [Proteus mirabilis]
MISTLDLHRQLNDQLILLTLIILPDPDKANNTIGITTSLSSSRPKSEQKVVQSMAVDSMLNAGQDIHIRAHSVSPELGGDIVIPSSRAIFRML